MTNNSRCLGYGFTNSKGVATLDYDAEGNQLDNSGYAGAGVGKLNVFASLDNPLTNSSVQSEPYSILDALFYDSMASDTSSSYTKTDCTVAFDTNKLVATRTGSGECYIQKSFTSTALAPLLGNSIRFECDVVGADANVRIMVYQKVNGAWSSITSNNTQEGTLTLPMMDKGWLIDSNATEVRIRLYLGDLSVNGTCSFKNWKLYVLGEGAKWIFDGPSYISSAGTMTFNTDGSWTIGTNGSNYALFGAGTGSSTSDEIYANIGECFEFDLISYTGSGDLRCNIRGGSTRTVTNTWTDNTHYKIEVVANGVKINGVTKTFADTGARNFLMRIENNSTFRIKNLIYY